MKRIFQVRVGVIGLILVAFMAIPLVVSRVAVASAEVFTSAVDKTTLQNKTVSITDLQVNGTGNDQLDMNLHVNEGNLQFKDNNTTGLTFDGPSNGSTLQFSGTRSDINTALTILQYRSSNVGAKTVEVTLGGGDGDVYNPTNKHAYKVVSNTAPGVNWNTAKAAAETMTYGGVNGYLATITSQQEHEFIANRISQDGWIGASDSAVEGEWRWVTGLDETGTQFWSGNGATGTVFGGNFSNWSQSGGSVEPNDGGGNEDCAEVRFSSGVGGKWNDRDCLADNLSYVVEFGSAGNLPTVASTSFDITVNAAPVIAFTALSPADNATVNSVNSISITFNQPMRFGEGEIKIFDSADDSEVASTYSGGTEDDLTFTFELSKPLRTGRSYYVNISDSFMEGLVTYYHGFDDKTTWNFTIADGDGISEAVENAAPNDGDGNNDGVQDSSQSNVSSLVDPVTGKYATLAVDEECDITSVSVAAEKTNQPDESYDYPAGLMDFSLDCGTPGFVATVSQYYHGVTGNFIVRKYNPSTNEYATITGAAISDQTIDGSQAKVATYQVADGGALDLDGQENGEIVDPAGLAISMANVVSSSDSQNLAKTGTSMIAAVLIAGNLTLVGAIATAQLRKKIL